MKYIYASLAVFLLSCLASMPYGYYMLIRFLAMIGFSVIAYKYYREKKVKLAWTFVALVLLFQPFAKIALGRLIWNIIDVVVGVGLIILLIIEEERDHLKIEE